MTDEEVVNFDEPRSFGISKYKLFYSIAAIGIIVGGMILDKVPMSPVFLGFVAIVATYLFLPFTYRLVVSGEAISSINLLSTKTLEWNEIAELTIDKRGILMANRDGDIKVFVNQQIDDYPLVVKFVQKQRPELWRLDEADSFHQEYTESVFFLLAGLGAFAAGIMMLFNNGLTRDMVIPILFVFGFSIFFVLIGSLRIRKLSLDGDILVVHYLFWRRQFHVKDILSVSLEPKFGKNILLYEVRIRISNKKDIVVENIKEGNPMLVNAIETWMKVYKENQKA